MSIFSTFSSHSLLTRKKLCLFIDFTMLKASFLKVNYFSSGWSIL
jgi:hypothetical protein